MKKLSLKIRLISSFLLVGLVPLMGIGLYFYKMTTSELQKESIQRLTAVQKVKKNSIEEYFNVIKSQVKTLSHDVMIIEAMKKFKKGYNDIVGENNFSKSDIAYFKSQLKRFYKNEFGAKYEKENNKEINAVELLNPLSDKEIALQYYYIANNTNPLGSKDKLTFSEDGSFYSKTHKKYHPSIAEFLSEFGYYDIFLVDNVSGEIVYSVYKELDYATSLLTGPYSNTNFADVFKKARSIQNKNDFAIVDYKKYTPSYEAPASFIAQPIWDGNKKIGVLIFQMPIDRLNAIMSDRAGLGKTGETYLVGPDRLLRSDTFLKQDKFNVVTSFRENQASVFKSPVIESVLAGESDARISTNYLEQKVISSFFPIDILGLKWGLIAEINTQEAFGASIKIKNIFLLIIGVVVLLVSVFGVLLSSNLSKRISNVTDKLKKLSETLIETSEKISQSSKKLSQVSSSQAASLQETTSSVDEISSMVHKNADAANKSSSISQKSNETGEKGKVRISSMVDSMKDIAKSNNEVESISKVISEISSKTKIINDIVFQTKLLSINASVEAAKAGEHGKGFAVVAEEVGNLAAISGKASLEITELINTSTNRVGEIVSTVKDKVVRGEKSVEDCGQVLDEILKDASEVNAMVKEIAVASAEQSTGVNEVTKAMRQLDSSMHENTGISGQTAKMAEGLYQQAEDLNQTVADLVSLTFGEGNQKNLEKKQESSNVVQLRQESHDHQSLKKVSGEPEVESRFKEL